jgi:glyoxylase-like metal-dependent hydrolase (beta-lactamase superfamily II)
VAFEHQDVRDGDTIRVGNVEVRVAHTPGHTPDSICLFVTDHARSPEPWFVLTGDLLFVGSVGRPDLGGRHGGRGHLVEPQARAAAPARRQRRDLPAHWRRLLLRARPCRPRADPRHRLRAPLQLRLSVSDDKNAFVDFIMAAIPAKPAAFDKIVAKNRGLVPLVAAKPRPYAAREAWEAIERGACVSIDLRDVNRLRRGPRGRRAQRVDRQPAVAERVAGPGPDRRARSC